MLILHWAFFYKYISMKFFISLLYLCISTTVYSQDTIVTNVRDTLIVYIISTDTEVINYALSKDIDYTDTYKISLSSVKVVKFKKSTAVKHGKTGFERNIIPFLTIENTLYEKGGPRGVFQLHMKELSTLKIRF